MRRAVSQRFFRSGVQGPRPVHRRWDMFAPHIPMRRRSDDTSVGVALRWPRQCSQQQQVHPMQCSGPWTSRRTPGRTPEEAIPVGSRPGPSHVLLPIVFSRCRGDKGRAQVAPSTMPAFGLEAERLLFQLAWLEEQVSALLPHTTCKSWELPAQRTHRTICGGICCTVCGQVLSYACSTRGRQYRQVRQRTLVYRGVKGSRCCCSEWKLVVGHIVFSQDDGVNQGLRS